MSSALPTPEAGPSAALEWTQRYLADLCGDDSAPSPSFRGGQRAADAALSGFDVIGYARRRNEVWPEARRGASRLSPYIRHGLLPLPRVWSHVEGGPARDAAKFQDELLWQEYARHLYARLGRRTGRSLARHPVETAQWQDEDPWGGKLACLEVCTQELEESGWLPNQTRMWLASHWTVRQGAPWRAGEDRFFRHLLDGSRAANRLGWQWTTGAAGGRPYGFSRYQVEKRAPGLCAGCALRDACPIDDWPEPLGFASRFGTPPRLLRDDDVDATGGPEAVERTGTAEAVWLTAESLGSGDPALAAHRDLPAVFVFDEALLARLRLSRKRLLFLVETLAELAESTTLEIHRGRPERVLGSRPLATTFAPVPGWKRIAERVRIASLHPWPWLERPHAKSLKSFSAWRRSLGA